MYDVFISSKSEDYHLANDVYEFLKNNDVHTFIATEELRIKGKSDFGSVIDDALDEATHLIVVATDSKYLFKKNSPYVYDEWHTFNEELKSGRKNGNLITILDANIKIESLPFALRSKQSLTLDNYKTGLLNFVVFDDTKKDSELKMISDIENDISTLKSQLDSLKTEIRGKIDLYNEIVGQINTKENQLHYLTGKQYMHLERYSDVDSKSAEKIDNLIKELSSVNYEKNSLKKRLADVEKELEGLKKKENSMINGHEYVDLGLPSGTLWATYNVGASHSEEYGYYYAWGETTPKETYNWSTYKFCRGSYNTQNKYNTESNFGTVDNVKLLEMMDDVAHVNWGGDWRMPTYDELYELKMECTWIWTTQGDKKGCHVIGPNGKSLFLPAAGYYDDNEFKDGDSYGHYWASSLGKSYPYYACRLYFGSNSTRIGDSYRYCGRPIRPVCSSRRQPPLL